MTNNTGKKYQLAIEWDNPFASHQNKGLLLYSVSPKEGMSEDEFEKFMSEQLFPAINEISTRAIRYKAKYLLIDAGAKEIDALSNHQVRDLISDNLGTHKLVESFLDLSVEKTASGDAGDR